MNRITVIGNIANEPALNFAKDGKALLKFRLAENTGHKVGDAWIKGETIFYQVTVFGAAAEAAVDFLETGSLVRVEGTFKSYKYEKNGVERTSLEIAGDVFLVPKTKRVERPDLNEPPF